MLYQYKIFSCRPVWTLGCSRPFTCHKSLNPTFHSVPFGIWRRTVWSFSEPELDSHTFLPTPWRHNELWKFEPTRCSWQNREWMVSIHRTQNYIMVTSN